MSTLVVFALLGASLSAPIYADGQQTVSSASGTTLSTGAPLVEEASTPARAGSNEYRVATAPIDTPTKDCCWDEINLDREPPAPRAPLGPDCCWDPVNCD
ncbi:MAG: hypothetical protein U9Q81_20525 [Pseudomonadota bacterium]|nr:hypothetical protein [Pseudomonadota bacterium]